MNKVEMIFKDKALHKGGVMLLSKDNAIQFIKACERESVKIFGIDGFLLFDEKIQPSLENSIDFSTSGVKLNVFNRAIDFINSREEKFFFEIVCE